MGGDLGKKCKMLIYPSRKQEGGSTRVCFRIDLISSVAVWKPSGVAQGLQTSGVAQGVQTDTHGPNRVRGAPRECVLELIGFPVSRSGSPRSLFSRGAPRECVLELIGFPVSPCATPGATAKRCFFHPLSGGNREMVFPSPPEVPFR